MKNIRKEALVLSLIALMSTGCAKEVKKGPNAPYVNPLEGKEVFEVINGKTIDVNLIKNTLCINDGSIIFFKNPFDKKSFKYCRNVFCSSSDSLFIKSNSFCNI